MRHSWKPISKSVDQCSRCNVTREKCSNVFVYSGSTLTRPECIIIKDEQLIQRNFKRNNDTAKKQEFIRQHKDEFKIYFVDEFFNWREMHRKYPNSKYYSPPALAMGNKIREIFGYSSTTNTHDILRHFKKLFIKLYPDYEFQTVKR